MNIVPTQLAGVYRVGTSTFHDSRGAFSRYYCENELASIVGNRKIVQINHSLTNAVGSVRGLHYQRAPHAEMKLVRCIKGSIWDIAVDLRAGSATFLQWHAEILSAENANMLTIPEGCAHGFQVLEANSEIIYFVTASYEPGAEGGVRYNDMRIAIDWPLAATEISDKDRQIPLLTENFSGISV